MMADMCTVDRDGRMVEADGSTIRFSDKGAHTTFGSDNWVMLTPGDGEEIQSLRRDGDYVIARKPSHEFIFYGTANDKPGCRLPLVFCYRVIADQLAPA